MAVPCALIASCTDSSPTELAKKILGKDDLSSGEHVIEDVTAYPWHVSTKYYTADIHICTTENRTIGTEEFADSVQALILIFDSKQESSFEKVTSWMPFAKEIDAPVEILVCERCELEDVVSRSKVHAWCLENSFELVELDPETFSDEEEDDFPETTGVKRIIQALHAHMWPNLEMKESPSFRSPYMNQMMASEAVQRQGETEEEESTDADEVQSGSLQTSDEAVPDPAGAGEACQAAGSTDRTADNNEGKPEVGSNEGSGKSQASASGSSTSISKEEKNRANSLQAGQESMDTLINDMALLSSMENEDMSDESFEQLFEKMQLMKQRAEHLPHDERRAYAEKMVITFWKAIGGDETEIDGLSDDDKP